MADRTERERAARQIYADLARALPEEFEPAAALIAAGNLFAVLARNWRKAMLAPDDQHDVEADITYILGQVKEAAFRDLAPAADGSGAVH